MTGRTPSVVIGGQLWTRVFGRDPSIVGRTLSLDRQSYTIVGVMGDRFEFRRGRLEQWQTGPLPPIAFWSSGGVRQHNAKRRGAAEARRVDRAGARGARDRVKTLAGRYPC
jgi:hypothetical protein